MSEHPNIVLIMTDQQRGDCLSAEGHPVLQTPTMDAIGQLGARFRRAYSTCPVCIPARRSLMSGQFPATHGMLAYRDNVEWSPAATLPGTLRDAGYETAIVGRSMHQYPIRKRFGYDRMCIFDHKSGGDDYGPWLKHNARVGNANWFGGGVMHNDWTARAWHLDESVHFTNWVVDESLRTLARRDPACPMFLTVSFIAPHPPLQPPAFYLDRYLRLGVPKRDIGDWAEKPETLADMAIQDPIAPLKIDLTGERLLMARAAYYGLINHVDDQMRRLLNGIDGMYRHLGPNTIVLFTSDHGEMLGDHYFWRKQQPYEASARVPLLVQGPRNLGLKQGAVIDEAVCLEDIMPTLLDLAGVPIPPSVEGRSLAPLLRGEKSLEREYIHLEYAPNWHALTDGREKYIWFAQNGEEQFFDLTRDPTERKNLAKRPSHRAKVARWRARLVKHLHGRPEGFSDGKKLVAGRPYNSLLPHAGKAH